MTKVVYVKHKSVLALCSGIFDEREVLSTLLHIHVHEIVFCEQSEGKPFEMERIQV